MPTAWETNMTQAILTNETAIEYAKNLIGGIEVTATGPSAEELTIPAIDVQFRCAGEDRIDTMTVWVDEISGQLYGEW
jgi:hypothetical protein